MFFESELYAFLTLFTDGLFSAESSNSSLPEGESKKEDTISSGRCTMDGELSRYGKPYRSERTNGVKTQVGGSRAGSKDSASSKNTLVEGTNEYKKKDDIPSKDEVLPVDGEPDDNVDLNSLIYFF